MFRYPKMYFRISTNRFLDIKNQCILGYPKIQFWISKNHTELRISIIRFLDIHKSFLDIQKSVYFRISKNPFLDIQNPAEFRISIIRFLDIHNSILGYPKIGKISMY